jgi:hypothetical protein
MDWLTFDRNKKETTHGALGFDREIVELKFNNSHKKMASSSA